MTARPNPVPRLIQILEVFVDFRAKKQTMSELLLTGVLVLGVYAYLQIHYSLGPVVIAGLAAAVISDQNAGFVDRFVLVPIFIGLYLNHALRNNALMELIGLFGLLFMHLGLHWEHQREISVSEDQPTAPDLLEDSKRNKENLMLNDSNHSEELFTVQSDPTDLKARHPVSSPVRQKGRNGYGGPVLQKAREDARRELEERMKAWSSRRR